MSSIKGFINWVKGEDIEDDYNAPQAEQLTEEAKPVQTVSSPSETSTSSRRSTSVSTNSNKVVNINGTTQLAVVLVKPDRFDTASDIADHLKNKRTVVVNLEQTEKDVARRMIDFLSGVAYAIEGKIKKVANSTYIITPYNVDIMGDLIDELESSGMYF